MDWFFSYSEGGTMLKEFKDFALRGNVMDMAVGIIIGAAFTSIVNSLVNDIIMPPFGLLLGGVDFSNFYLILKGGSPAGPYLSLADASAAGAVTLNYGLFINAIISFLLVALAMFLLIRAINRLHSEKTVEEPAAPTSKDCPYCFTSIPLKATRCPHCTSQLE
jgi:large conductance mechanosensitive channel